MADVFGREERLEDAALYRRRYPGPVSPISTNTESPSRLVWIVNVPSPSMASMALWMMLVHTWLSSPLWAQILGIVRS